jgi:Vault protein inter-alpha-trypsin domain
VIGTVAQPHAVYKGFKADRNEFQDDMHYCHIHPYCGIYYFSPIIVNTVTAPTPSWLPQVSLSTNVKLYDTSSRTTLTQLFVNPSKKEEIEQAKYNFPLYESCAVVAFRCFVQGRLIEGFVKEKNETMMLPLLVEKRLVYSNKSPPMSLECPWATFLRVQPLKSKPNISWN